MPCSPFCPAVIIQLNVKVTGEDTVVTAPNARMSDFFGWKSLKYTTPQIPRSVNMCVHLYCLVIFSFLENLRFGGRPRFSAIDGAEMWVGGRVNTGLHCKQLAVEEGPLAVWIILRRGNCARLCCKPNTRTPAPCIQCSLQNTSLWWQPGLVLCSGAKNVCS